VEERDQPAIAEELRQMADTGRFLMVIGLVLVLLGAAVWGLDRLGFRGLPGDIRYESENVRIYFPVVTCLLLSVLLSAGLWLWQWLSRR
jgi:hypothetical protein